MAGDGGHAMPRQPNTPHEEREHRDERTVQYRIHTLFFVIFLCFSILIVRLAYIQFVEGDSLTAEEYSQATRTVYIPPIRGNIYDRNGYPIAYSTSAQSLYYRIEPGKKLQDHQQLAARLANVFLEYGDKYQPTQTMAEVFDSLDVGTDVYGKPKDMFHLMYSPRRIKTGLTSREIAYVLSHPEQFPGIEVVEESVRHYDTNTIAVQLIGYLKPFSVAKNQRANYLAFYQDKSKTRDYLLSEDVGFDGIEFMYQDVLRGKAGERKYPVNSRDQIIGTVEVTSPKKGDNLYLTIDKDVQLVTEQAIVDQLAYMKSPQAKSLKYPAMGANAKMGFAVAMEVDTGNVVAMASMPDYDSNVWSGGISTKGYAAIQPYYQNGTIKTVYPNVLNAKERARHPSSIVPLGSTIKPLTVLIGLHERLYTPTTTYVDKGRVSYGRNNATTVSNAQKKAHGRIDAEEAIKYSSNTFMVEMVGLRLYDKYGGESENVIDVWDRYMKQFGLGVPTGSGLPVESAGVVDYRGKSRGSVQNGIAMASFGQQARYTTLQLTQYVATIASKGKRMKPQFLSKITDFEGKVMDVPTPTTLETMTFSSAYWDTVHRGMRDVTQTSTLQRWFGKLPFSVASKTGTSQQDTAAGKIENAVFVAFAPAEQPKLAVAVVVPWGGYGGWGAAPIAAKIMEAYDTHVGFKWKGPRSSK